MIGAPQYLLTLYVVEREDDEGSPISSGYIVDALDRSPPAATERLQNLDVKGLVDYGLYEDATLTAEGYDATVDLRDIYQILLRFCRDVLGVSDHEGEAMQLVRGISPAVVERLSVTLLHGDGDRGGTRQAAGSELTSSPDNPVNRVYRRKFERSLMLVNKRH